MIFTIMAGVKTNGNLIGTIYMVLNWNALFEKLQELKLVETGRLFAINNKRNIMLNTQNKYSSK